MLSHLLWSSAPSALDQGRTPYVDALRSARAHVAAPFFLPGHKLGEGLPDAAAPILSCAAPYDLPELGELDNLFAPVGPLDEAQRLAAEAFGARRTWFLANGSSAGVIAAIVGCVRLAPPGARAVLLPRNAHRSAVHALVHSGAQPVWLVPEIDEQIAKAIMKGLEREPNDRWQSIAEMVKEIREAEVRLVGIVKSAKAHARKQKAAAAKKAATQAAAAAASEAAAKTDPPTAPKTDKPVSKSAPEPAAAVSEDSPEDEDDFLALPDDDETDTSTDDEMPRLDSNADILAAEIDDDDLSLD